MERVVELTVPEEEPIGSLMRIIPSITGLVTGDPAAEPSGAGGGVDSAGGGTNRKPDEYYPTNHMLLQGILPLSLVERVVELTVPEEEPIGSLMSIIPPITGLVTGDPAAEPSGQVVELTVPEEEPIGSLMSIVRPITRCYRGSCR